MDSHGGESEKKTVVPVTDSSKVEETSSFGLRWVKMQA
jgi:hypothetical protein